jgi:transcriptional regulator with XRE-family HTH domain
MSLKNNLPILLKKLRQHAKWTQAAVAEKLKITQAQWSAYESNKNTPSFDMIEKICGVFNVAPKDFFSVLCDEENFKKKSFIALIKNKTA